MFAGLYYSVNKLGVYYGHNGVSPDEEGVINGGNGVPPESGFVVEDSGEGVDSFCGMDVNNFMEGECSSFYDVCVFC